MRDGCVRAAVAVTPEGRPPAPHVHGAQTLLSCRGVGSARLLDAAGGGGVSDGPAADACGAGPGWRLGR